MSRLDALGLGPLDAVLRASAKPALAAEEPGLTETTSLPAQTYDEVLSKNYDLLLERDASFRREVASAPQLFQELMRHPQSRREVLIRNLDRYRSWGLVEHLLTQTAQMWFEEPREAILLAELALFIASQLDETNHSEGLLNDLKARCWVHLANVHRILADLNEAERGFAEAHRLLLGGTDDPMERANFLSAFGRLRIDQRRYPEAEDMLQRSISLYKRLGDRHLAGRTMVTLTVMYNDTGEHVRTIATLQRALDHIDVARDPRLLLFARHNLMQALCTAERFLEARSILIETRPLYDRFASTVLRLQQQWLQGQIALGLGQLNAAIRFLQQAQEGFLDLQKADQAALISLELAQAYLRRGESEKVAELAQQALETYRALDIPREVFASLLLIAEAARDKRLSIAFVGEILRRVRAARDGGTQR